MHERMWGNYDNAYKTVCFCTMARTLAKASWLTVWSGEVLLFGLISVTSGLLKPIKIGSLVCGTWPYWANS